MEQEAIRESPNADHQEGGGMVEEHGNRPGVLIITRNNLALTKKTVASVMAQDIPFDLVVIDNQSTDGTIQWALTKAWTFVHLSHQKSLAHCWNLGLKTLWTSGHETVLVLNNDVEIRPDTLRLLLAHGGEFVTCVSVDSKERLGVAGDRDIEELKKTQREHPDYSCWLIRKSVTDKGIWFNEDCYPAYCEDSFHHVACVRAGIRPVCVDVPFFHYAAGTLKCAGPGEAERIKRGAQSNREMFRAKYGCYPGTPEYEALFSEGPSQ